MVGIVVASCLSGAGATPAAADPGPTGYNVLVLMCDEHSPRVLGCYGDPLVKTPTLDSLAAAGVRFTAAYCQNPVCVPSRVALASGKMPCHLNTFGNGNTPNYDGVTTMADVFNRAGYRTAWFGKQHWGDPHFAETSRGGENTAAAKKQEDESFGRLPQQSQVSKCPVEENGEHITANEAIDFLKANKDRKFFLGVSFVKPHFPFTIQQQYYDLYAGRVREPSASEELIHDLPAVSKLERDKYGFAKATATDISRTRAIYYGMVTYVDEEFGRVLRQLDELGLREKTIILYTADHGEMLGDRGIWYKNSFYDGSASIPFIWSFPKELPRGGVSAAPVMNIDVLPTLCELCGLPVPARLEGSSLVRVLKGGDAGEPRYALSESYRDNFAGRMVRTARWKYFFYTNGDQYLYDMVNDPGETRNLASEPEHRELAAELKRKASVGWVLPSGKAKKGKKGREQ
jgi:choline-sulfatase